MKKVFFISILLLFSISVKLFSYTITWDFNSAVANNKAEGWNIVYYTNGNTSNGILNLTAQTYGNIRLDEYANPYNPSYYKYVIIKLKNPTAQTQARFYWWEINNATPYYTEFDITANDTGFKEYVINLGAITNWTGRTAGIRIIRFDVPKTITGASIGQTVSIDYIKLSAYAPMPAKTGEPFGVNLAGAEFGHTQGPDYSYPTVAELDYFKAKGLKLFRLPFKWERIQPTLNSALNTTELAKMKDFVTAARERGLWVILDMHNYGRRTYYTDTVIIGSPTLSIAHVTDAWKKLAAEFKNWDNIYGYGIMNEPHGMLASTPWFNIAQGIITGIRTIDTRTAILVGGDDWSSAMKWQTASDNLKNLNDSANNLIYEAHIYFDKNAGGLYQQSYDQEEATHNIGVVRVAPFVKWLKANNKRGFVGEYGVPNDDPRWLVALDNMLNYLKQNCVNGTYWAAGPRWNTYRLSVEPLNGQDRVQMSVLQNHTSANTSSGSTINDDRSMMHNWEFNRPVISNKAEGWTIVSYGSPVTSNSTLNLTTVVGYNYIKYDIPAIEKINTSLHKYAIIKLKNTTAKTQASFYWHDGTAYNNVVFTITANDTGYKEYVINLSQNTNWTSKTNLNLIRFDIPMGAITGSENKTVSIDYIKLATSAPVGITSFSMIEAPNNASLLKNEKVNVGKEVVIIPNPVDNQITLQLNSGIRILKLKIFSMDGRLVLESTGTITKISQNLNQQISSFKQGIYVLMVEDERDTYVQKFIKN